MTKKRPYKHPQFNLRIPEDLKEQIEKSAKEAGRSMNAEIIYRIQRSYDVYSISDESTKALKEALSEGVISVEQVISMHSASKALTAILDDLKHGRAKIEYLDDDNGNKQPQ